MKRTNVAILAVGIGGAILAFVLIFTLFNALLAKPGEQITQNGAITVWHDEERGATCWLYFRAGISCLPDSEVRR